MGGKIPTGAANGAKGGQTCRWRPVGRGGAGGSEGGKEVLQGGRCSRMKPIDIVWWGGSWKASAQAESALASRPRNRPKHCDVFAFFRLASEPNLCPVV